MRGRRPYLQSNADSFESLDLLSVDSDDAPLRRLAVAQDVAVMPHEEVVSLVVQRDDLAADDLGLRREKRPERLGCQYT